MTYTVEKYAINDARLYADMFHRPTLWLGEAINICSGLLGYTPYTWDWDHWEVAEALRKQPDMAHSFNIRDDLVGHVATAQIAKNFPYHDAGIEYHTENGKARPFGDVEPVQFVAWLLGKTELPTAIKDVYFELRHTSLLKYGTLYKTPYIDLMLTCIEDLKITASNQLKKATIEEWFKSRSSATVPLSANMAKLMATFVRLPESQIGGNKKTLSVDPF